MGYVLELPKNTTTIRTTQPDTPAEIRHFEPKEIDMMPGNWAEPGNPTPYELRTTIHTCRRLWQQNKDALLHPDCDRQTTLENIKKLEKLHIHLMDYLVE